MLSVGGAFYSCCSNPGFCNEGGAADSLLHFQIHRFGSFLYFQGSLSINSEAVLQNFFILVRIKQNGTDYPSIGHTAA
jgi:hypothetical protein